MPERVSFPFFHVLEDCLGSAFQTQPLCTSDSTGRDSTLQLYMKCLKMICTKIKVALEQNSVENGVNNIFTVLDPLAVKACY